MSKTTTRRTIGTRKVAAVTRGRRPAKPRDHSDPIIADNARVRVDFSWPPRDLDQGRLWMRRYTAFESLVPKFDNVPQPVQPVKDVSSITFAYSRANHSSRDEELVFMSTGLGAILISVGVGKLTGRPSKDRRFLFPSGLSNLRLRTVSGEDPSGARFTFNLFDGDRPRFRDVQFTIKAQPKPESPAT
jgi:hypothetical protein